MTTSVSREPLEKRDISVGDVVLYYRGDPDKNRLVEVIEVSPTSDVISASTISVKHPGFLGAIPITGNLFKPSQEDVDRVMGESMDEIHKHQKYLSELEETTQELADHLKSSHNITELKRKKIKEVFEHESMKEIRELMDI